MLSFASYGFYYYSYRLYIRYLLAGLYYKSLLYSVFSIQYYRNSGTRPGLQQGSRLGAGVTLYSIESAAGLR